jgi:hypothetical protein
MNVDLEYDRRYNSMGPEEIPLFLVGITLLVLVIRGLLWFTTY